MAAMARNPNTRSRDMFLSMAVIVVPVLLLVWFFSSPGEEKPQRGESGVPFMKSTTSCSATAWAMKAWAGSAAVCSVTVSKPFLRSP